RLPGGLKNTRRAARDRPQALHRHQAESAQRILEARPRAQQVRDAQHGAQGRPNGRLLTIRLEIIAMAAKKKASKPQAAGSLPAGFKPITSERGIPWDMEKMPELVGTWLGARTIQVKRGRKMEEQRVATVRTADGTVYTVWESAMLVPLFEQAVADESEVAIVYKGLGKAKPGQNPPKIFEV